MWARKQLTFYFRTGPDILTIQGLFVLVLISVFSVEEVCVFNPIGCNNCKAKY